MSVHIGPTGLPVIDRGGDAPKPDKCSLCGGVGSVAVKVPDFDGLWAEKACPVCHGSGNTQEPKP